MSEPCVPIALRRLRHVEFFALVSRGSYASTSHQQQGGAAATASPEPTSNNNQQQQQLEASASGIGFGQPQQQIPTSFKHFFPDDRSCCRMELVLPRTTSNSGDGAQSPEQQQQQQQQKVIYRSEPIAPTRHPRFSPISADVRHFSGGAENVVVRVVAETLNHGHAVCADAATAPPSPVRGSGNATFSSQQQQQGGSGSVAAAAAPALVHLDFRSDSSIAAAAAHLRKTSHHHHHHHQGAGVAFVKGSFAKQGGENNNNNTEKFVASTTQAAGGRSGGAAAKISAFFDDNYEGASDDENEDYDDLWGSSYTEPRTMAEINVCFSKLEFVAETFAEATEVLSERLKKKSISNKSSSGASSVDGVAVDDHPMECLVVCTDGVFCVPRGGETANTDNNDDTISTSTVSTIAASAAAQNQQQQQQQYSSVSPFARSAELLLKQMGNETSSGAGGSPTTKSDQGGWEVVASAHDADRFNEAKTKQLITPTLTLHFAEVLLKRRALLEKERLVKDLQAQLAGGVGATEKQEEQEEEEVDKDKQQNPNTRPSIRQELTRNYRQMIQDDGRRQIEALRTQLTQQEAVAEMLQEQLRGRKVALEGRRRDLEQRTKSCAATKETTSIDQMSASILEKQLRLCRNKVLAGMQRIFPITTVAPHSICGFNIPHNEPQNEQHATALGCIVHAIVTFCSVHGHVPLHPLISHTSRSAVAEFVGAPASKIFPLYATNAAEKEASLRAVMLLRRVMAHAAFSIHNQRQASDLPFGIALQKLLFNR